MNASISSSPTADAKVAAPIELIAETFNKMEGRLRVSVTHACQLSCQFCHREGINDHWKPVHISPPFLKSVVDAYASIGGSLVELTGGEPTLHPQISDLVSNIAQSSCRIILCTNGLRLDRLQKNIERGDIDYIKLSLHATEANSKTSSLLGKAWDIGRLKANVEAARLAGARFQLIFTHSASNTQYLEGVVRMARDWDTDLQIVDLIPTRVGNPATQLGYKRGLDAVPAIASLAKLEREIRDRTGAVLKLYKSPSGRSWEIKDYHYGLLHSDMCVGCVKRDLCGEGIYALRVDALGQVKPCLLRDDLQKDISQVSQPEIVRTLSATLRAMLSGRLEWG